ncbi:MAG: hypothetical protein Kow00109_07570 [Acidobacteriota bacterium]
MSLKERVGKCECGAGNGPVVPRDRTGGLQESPTSASLSELAAGGLAEKSPTERIRGELHSAPVWSLVAFQVGWWSCVGGAAWGYPWLGPTVVALLAGWELGRTRNRVGLFCFLALLTAGGWILDSKLAHLGVFQFGAGVEPALSSPAWMAALWANLGLALPGCLRFLEKRPVLAVVLGAAGGPAAYYTGARLGVLVVEDLVSFTVVLALVWGLALPLLFWIRRHCLELAPRRLAVGGGGT